jgi:hypothetical protein
MNLHIIILSDRFLLNCPVPSRGLELINDRSCIVLSLSFIIVDKETEGSIHHTNREDENNVSRISRVLRGAATDVVRKVWR